MIACKIYVFLAICLCIQVLFQMDILSVFCINENTVIIWISALAFLCLRPLLLNHQDFLIFTGTLSALNLQQRCPSVSLILILSIVVRFVCDRSRFHADTIEVFSRRNASYNQGVRKGQTGAGGIRKWWPCVRGFP